ncbi:HAD-IA family hydrolase [Thalassorhabdomicrobium marinisediminis]|nr:HAD-IA family hydrolase [Thalassorhabdomicrobium marinisediminis]
MPPKALIFGSIGTLAEITDLERRAFNAAFDEHGLDWTWDEETYADLLTEPDGERRIEQYAAQHDTEVDAMSLHASTIKHLSCLVDDEGLRARPGVYEMVSNAKKAGVALGFATTASPDTLTLMFSGLFPDLPRSVFDYIGSHEDVTRNKPAPDIYEVTLKELGVAAGDALAIEDTPEAARAAVAAGIETLGFAHSFSTGRSFPDGVEEVDILPVDIFADETPAA